MKDIITIKEFFVEGNNREVSHVLLHITEPTTPAEIEKGYFFALSEINYGDLGQIQHLQKMIEDLESSFYESDLPSKQAFEQTLEFINKRSHHVLQENDSQVHCIVGRVLGNEIAFTEHGDMDAWVFYATKDQTLKVIDVLQDEKRKKSSDQLFSNIIEGKLNQGDSMLVVSGQVKKYFNLENFQHLIANQSQTEVVHHIKKTLESINSNFSYGGIFCKIFSEQNISETKNQTHPEDDAPNILQEQSTQSHKKALIPHSPHKNVKATLEKTTDKKKKKIFQNTPETNYRPRKSLEKESFFNALLIGIGRAVISTVIFLFRLLKNFFRYLLNFCIMMFVLITNKGGQRSQVLDEMQENVDKRKEQVHDLPLLSKLLFILTFLFAIVFTGSLLYLRHQEDLQVTEKQQKELLLSIEDKINAANASLIYSDDSKALTLYQEAKGLLAQLEENTQTSKEHIRTIHDEIEEGLRKLQKLTLIDAEIVVDANSIIEQPQLESLALIDDTMLAYGQNDKRGIKISSLTNDAILWEHTAIPELIQSTTPKEQDIVVFTTAGKDIAVFDKETQGLTQKTILFSNENSSIADVFVYNTKVYTLDPTTHQIYKHNKTQTGYDRGVPWLQEDINLAGANSLAIDGDVYVLQNGNTILKFTKGKQEEFEVKGLQPELHGAHILWTYSDVPYLFILEPETKRVILLEKNGKLMAQYTSEKWQQPTGMVVKPAIKQIFVLDQNKVYKFNY